MFTETRLYDLCTNKTDNNRTEEGGSDHEEPVTGNIYLEGCVR